jgi:hypothetical protein
MLCGHCIHAVIHAANHTISAQLECCAATASMQ